MACRIRQSKLIHGIKLPLLDDNQEVIISQFADDKTLFVRDEESITNVLETLATFSISIVVYGCQATIHDSKYGTTRALFAKYIHGKTDENHVLFSNL